MVMAMAKSKICSTENIPFTHDLSTLPDSGETD